MKTMSPGSTALMRPSLMEGLTLRKALLICGPVSALVYLAMNLIGAQIWQGYSLMEQTISELFAIGAPTKLFADWVLAAYTLLLYALGVGVWMSAGQKRILKIAAALIIAKEIFGPLATFIFPMHVRGMEATISDTMHGILTIAGVFLCMFPAMILGAVAFRGKFRVYTLITILLFLAGGIYTFTQVSAIGANQPTPWAGLLERVNAFGYILWYSVLAVILYRQPVSNHSLDRR